LKYIFKILAKKRNNFLNKSYKITRVTSNIMYTTSPYYNNIQEKLRIAFTDPQSKILAEVITIAYNDLVKTSDFNELKGIVKELADAQKRTEFSIQQLTSAVNKTNQDLGGLSDSVAYSLENEAYRMLPQYLLQHYQIKISSKMIRTEINEEEINIFGIGTKDGKEILLVGEVALKLLNTKKFVQLDRKIKVVQKIHNNKEIFKLLITHYAKPSIIEKAKRENITVIQSFEW